jgi:ABC-type transporter Mla MlaB component
MSTRFAVDTAVRWAQETLCIRPRFVWVALTLDSLGRPFGVSIEEDGDQITLVLVGELELASVDEVDRLLRTIIPARLRRLVIDLRAVEFIDSARPALAAQPSQRRQTLGMS